MPEPLRIFNTLFDELELRSAERPAVRAFVGALHSQSAHAASRDLHRFGHPGGGFPGGEPLPLMFRGFHGLQWP